MDQPTVVGIAIKNLFVEVVETPEGVVIDVWPSVTKGVDSSIATMGVMFSDAEEKEEEE